MIDLVRPLAHLGWIALLIGALGGAACTDPGGDDPTGDDDDATVSEDVTILRDVYGIPHIYADTMAGASYGFGYAQAEDHLETMLVHYLAADGRVSEVLEAGEAALVHAGYGDPVNVDHMAHLFRTRAAVDERWDEIDDLDDPAWGVSTTELLTAFAAGVDAYVADHPSQVPAWWDGELEPQSVAAWMRRFLLSYQTRVIDGKLAGRGAPTPQESNEWVVGPQRTADGSVYLQSDPHLPFSGVTLWYEAHLVGGDLEVAGATLYGMPLIVMGHNRTLAYTQTSNAMDNADLFEVEVVAGDPTRYRYGDEQRPFVFEEITLPLAGGGTETLSLAWTHHGPVVEPRGNTDFADHDTVLVGAATMFDVVHSYAQFLKMDRATTVAQWRAAMQDLQLQRWNFVVGDADGTIFYVSNSRHPDRAAGVDWDAPVDGSDPALDWTVDPPWAFDDLAWAEQSSGDFFQNCNNSPGWITPIYGDAIDEASFPDHYFHHDTINVRGMRAMEQLASHDQWTFDELQALSMDVHCKIAEWYVPALDEAYQTYGGHPSLDDPAALATAADVLAGWDYRATVDSEAMTLFEAWLAVAGAAVDAGAPPPDPVSEEQALGALQAMAEAVRLLEDTYGSAAVPWGEVHRIRRGDLDLPIAGSGPQTPMLFMATPSEEQDGIGYAGRGSSYMKLTRFASDGTVEAVSIKPWGNSDDPSSPHYADLTALYAVNEYKPLWFERGDIETHLESTTALTYSR